METTEHRYPMEIFPNPLHPILGLLFSGASGASVYLADATGAQNEGWIQLGGTIGLIAGLSYACKTLWTELQNSRKETATLNDEIRNDWKSQNSKLIAVLERIDPTEGKE